jgi:hypothetical protein
MGDGNDQFASFIRAETSAARAASSPPATRRAAARDRDVHIALVHATLTIAASMPPNVYNTITQVRTTP